MEIKLNVDGKYLLNTNVIFVYKSIDHDDPERREYIYPSRVRDDIPVIIVKEIQTLNEYFSRIFFTFENLDEYAEYQRDGNPFLLIYDDIKFPIDDNLATSLFFQYKNAPIAISKLNDSIIEYDEEFLKRTTEIDQLIVHAQAILNAQNALKKKLEKEFFNEKNEFLKYNKKVQDILKEKSHGTEIKN